MFWFVLFCSGLSYFGFSCTVLFCIVLICIVLLCFGVSRYVLSCPVLSCLVIFYFALYCLVTCSHVLLYLRRVPLGLFVCFFWLVFPLSPLVGFSRVFYDWLCLAFFFRVVLSSLEQFCFFLRSVVFCSVVYYLIVFFLYCCLFIQFCFFFV